MIQFTERIYCTNTSIKRVGRAVAISLEDVPLPGNATNKHMTILYRHNPKWAANEIELMNKESNTWIKKKYGNNKASVTFTLQKWSNGSCKINGDLNELCSYLRLQFGKMSKDTQRVPHVQLFNRKEVLKERLRNMILETEHPRLHEQQTQLQNLLDKVDNSRLDAKRIKKEIRVFLRVRKMILKTKRIQMKKEQRLRKMILKTNELEQKKQNVQQINFQILFHNKLIQTSNQFTTRPIYKYSKYNNLYNNEKLHKMYCNNKKKYNYHRW